MDKKTKLRLGDLKIKSFITGQREIVGGVAQPGTTSVYEPSVTCECSVGSSPCCNVNHSVDECDSGWTICWM